MIDFQGNLFGRVMEILQELEKFVGGIAQLLFHHVEDFSYEIFLVPNNLEVPFPDCHEPFTSHYQLL